MEGNKTAYWTSIGISFLLVPAAMLPEKSILYALCWLNFMAFHLIWIVPIYQGEPYPEDNAEFFRNSISKPVLLFAILGIYSLYLSLI